MLALQVLIIIAATACAADRQSQRSTTWAAHFISAAERIEARARSVGMARLHDVRAEQAELRGWMETVSQEMALGGAEAQGPGHYALGCGERALGREAEALTHLEAAWNAGFRDPRVAWVRTQILSERYRALRLEAITAPDPDERKAREQDAESKYREPVLTLLRQAAGAEYPSTDYGAALVAMHEDRLDAALALLEGVNTKHPWFVEARLMRADVFLLRAAWHWKGNRRKETGEDMTAAFQALKDARTTAESFAPAHLGLARFEAAGMNLFHLNSGPVLLLSSGDDEESGPGKEGLAALDAAARVDPGHAGFACEKARFLTMLAERPNTYAAFLSLRRKAVETAQRILELEPASACGRMERTRVMVQETEAVLKESRVDFYKLQEALDLLEAVPPSGRDLAFHLLRARLLQLWTEADLQVGSWRVGSNGWKHQEQAIEAWRSAVAIEKRVAAYWVQLGELLLARASNPTAKDVDQDLEPADKAVWHAMGGGSTKAAEVWLLWAHTEVAHALRKRAQGETAPWRFEQAAHHLRNALLDGAHNPTLHHELGLVLLEHARETWEHGGDPTALLQQAEAAQAQAAKLAPSLDLSKFGQAAVHAARAEYAWWRGADPTEQAERADAFYSQARPFFKTHKNQQFAGRMKVSHILARHLLEQGRDPDPVLKRPWESLDIMERIGQDRVLRYLATGTMFSLRARHSARTDPEKAEKEFVEAEKSYEEALQVEPLNREVRLEEGQLFREWAVARNAAKQDPEPLLSKGLALADALLKERPNWPEALLLRAAILRTKDPGSAQARADRDAALKANANLAPGWARQFPEDGPLTP
ncbi:hypothetical protein HRD49_07730 [Corallococcus exiguus]|uniref:hypothetical protein n=2 Tax=Pseudomonadati TaxID=3379134 RepID=UPI000EA1DC0C|nr:hypothetical protein [Corallococcus exiguus]NRD61641.1 hypothetical protein [Corallococcus exiguus]RKH27326.1 hypothetical protein D7V77_11985 [Corallococcus sp. CA041A]